MFTDPSGTAQVYSAKETIGFIGLMGWLSDTLGQIQGYEKYLSLSKSLGYIGFVLNILDAAHVNYNDDTLTTQEKEINFCIDVAFISMQTVGAFFLTKIPYCGALLAIVVPVFVDWAWSGDLEFFGVKLSKNKWGIISGRTIEEWFKSWVNSWFAKKEVEGEEVPV